MESKKRSTVLSYVSAIKAVLIEDGRELHEDKFLISAMTSACKIRNDRIHHKLPIKKGLLTIMLCEFPKLFGKQPYLFALFRAMFVKAYYGLLRISEIAETPSGHALKAIDVHVGRNKEKLKLILHTSKTNNKGSKPQIIKLNKQEVKGSTKQSPIHCLFGAVTQYAQIRAPIRNDTEQFLGGLSLHLNHLIA